MGDYKVYQCTRCGATILRDTRYTPSTWNWFSDLNSDIPCCDNPNIGWADSRTITLPDDDIPEPEFPRRSRIELALEDAFHG